MDLLHNPFHILNASPRDNRRRIMELADERSLLLDSSESLEARSTLTTPRKRLAAEVAWLPGIGPKRAGELLSLLESSPAELFAVDKLSPIARANLLAAGLARLSEHDADDVAAWILEIAWAFEDVDPDDLRMIINEERVVSGFTEESDRLAVEDEIKERRRYYRQVIKSALDSLSPKELVEAITVAVETATDDGEEHGPILIADLVDSYEVEAQGFLDKEEENIRILVEKLRAAVDAERQDSLLAAMVNQLIQVVKNWDTVAQPIQVSSKSRGLDHDASHRVAGLVRGLAIHMFEKHDNLDFPQQLTNMLKEVFAEVDEVAERIAEDIETLDEIAEQQATHLEITAIEKIVNEIKFIADNGKLDSFLSPKINQLCEFVLNFEPVPGQDASQHVAWIVRELAIHLFNKHEKIHFAQQIAKALQKVFAGFEEVGKRLAGDIDALDKISENQFINSEVYEIEKIVDNVKSGLEKGQVDSDLSPIINLLCQLILNWKIDKRHDSSQHVAWLVRDLAICLVNDHGKIDFSQQIIKTLQKMFGGVGDISRRLVEDADAIVNISRQRTRLIEEEERRAEEKIKEITYEADVGVIFKDKLRISPDGIEWKGRHWALDSITRVRWGGTRHSINGIPTGTTYSIVFGNDSNSALIELKNVNIYNNFIDRLWKTVGVRLLSTYLKGLRDGKKYHFGSVVLSDFGVELERKKLFGSGERIFCQWTELVTWGGAGVFCIGKKDDKKLAAALSYQEEDNIHVLETALRIFLKRGGDRLSSLLEN